jgi:hypothetical protein
LLKGFEYARLLGRRFEPSEKRQSCFKGVAGSPKNWFS